MPRRHTQFVNNQIYHIFNKTIENRQIFQQKKDAARAIIAFWYYRYQGNPYSLSNFLRLGEEKKDAAIQRTENLPRQVNILSYCLMKNHYHLLIEQTSENGISKFINDFQNSFVRYYNIKYSRQGPLFINQFKAVLVEQDDQLKHVSRYIHLNPYSGHIVKTFEKLIDYPWSSLKEYLNSNKTKYSKYQLLSKEKILRYYEDVEDYKWFVLDHADYQKDLVKIDHLVNEL